MVKLSLFVLFELLIINLNCRDGKPLEEQTEKYTVKKEGRKQSVVIRDAKIEDVAEYTCVAENVKTKTELELKGSEEKIETVVQEVKEQIATKGQETSYRVDFKKELHRKPSVKWMFNGKEVDVSSERVSYIFMMNPTARAIMMK